jgi:hypothetical protein
MSFGDNVSGDCSAIIGEGLHGSANWKEKWRFCTRAAVFGSPEGLPEISPPPARGAGQWKKKLGWRDALRA